MTLVEVVAGLALLAGVLGGILMVKARLARQSRDVVRRQQAIAAADSMLRDWFADPAKFPRIARGPVPGIPGLAWRTFPVPNPQAEALGGEVVRLEVSSDATAQRPPLVAIEVVLPSEAKHDAGVHAH